MGMGPVSGFYWLKDAVKRGLGEISFIKDMLKQ